jgi:hypothetical protein
MSMPENEGSCWLSNITTTTSSAPIQASEVPYPVHCDVAAI